MNSIRKILAAVILACIIVTLTGCTPDIVGTWKLTGGNALQAVYSINDSAQLDTNEASAVFTFEDNGKLTIVMTRDDIENNAEGSWNADGDNVTLTIDGSPVTCTYSVNGDTLNLFFTLDGQNANFIFTRK